MKAIYKGVEMSYLTYGGEYEILYEINPRVCVVVGDDGANHVVLSRCFEFYE